MSPFESTHKLKKELDALRPLKKADEKRIMQKFRLEWNFHSNHLEGNSLTFGETKALILFGITAQGKPLKDHVEITGHDEAVNWIFDIVKQDRPISENFIRQLHELILKEPYEIEARTPEGEPTRRLIQIGRYKEHPNHVLTNTGEMFYFASPEETPAKMTDLIDWYREAGERDEDPIETAIRFHYRFILIHPFDDGNGRTARILMNLILMRAGYPPVIIRTEDKAQYIAALQQADVDIFEPFIEFLVTNLDNSLELMIRGAKGEKIDDDDDIDKKLSLLDQKLKGIGKKVKHTKDQRSIKIFYEGSLWETFKKFNAISSKFNKYYVSYAQGISLNGNTQRRSNTSNGKDLFINVGRKITDRTDHIRFEYHYNTFNNTAIPYFQFFSEINVRFDKLTITIWAKDESKKLTLLYNDTLNNSQIDEIVEETASIHMKFIEERLEESKRK